MRRYLCLILVILGFQGFSYAYSPDIAPNIELKPVAKYSPNPAPVNEAISTLGQVDFGPYMRELQRRIKMCWDPPKGHDKDRVVLTFTILKDGRLQNCEVFKSSGYGNVDKAAVMAVRLAAPFRPLPVGYKGDKITVQFTFDYNTLGSSI